MRVLRYLLPTVAAAVAVSSFGFAQTPETERDTEALKEFTKTKRTVSVRDKGGDLSLSGDVRMEYQSIAETIDGNVQRGSGSPENTATNAGRPNHVFDVEVNLMLDYRADDSWASVKLEFDNDAGSTVWGSGNDNSVALQRAYAGYNVFEEDTARLDFELGRRKLYDLFTSKVQFASTMDGLVLKYANSLEGVGDFYANGGIWLVDDIVDHYAWALELGLSDISDSGLYALYSYIDWDNSGVDRTGRKPNGGAMLGRRWQSRNSQLMVGYKLHPEVLDNDLNLYAAYLMNHASKKLTRTNDKKKNKAWYVGARLGRIEYAGDWSVDFNWQHVGAQAVLDQEVTGIGRGNVNAALSANSTDDTAASAVRGNANYKGYAVEALYALTDNWTWGMEYESSNPADKKVGGRNGYHKFEVETVFSF